MHRGGGLSKVRLPPVVSYMFRGYGFVYIQLTHTAGCLLVVFHHVFVDSWGLQTVERCPCGWIRWRRNLKKKKQRIFRSYYCYGFMLLKRWNFNFYTFKNCQPAPVVERIHLWQDKRFPWSDPTPNQLLICSGKFGRETWKWPCFAHFAHH